MNDSIQTFRDNITRAKNLGGIYNALASETTPVLDLSDILRAELAITVSVFDYFIHLTVEEGMLEIYQQNRPTTDAYDNFQISLQNISSILVNPVDIVWFKDEIHKKIGHLSFQRSDKISSIMKLISDKILWNETSQIMDITPQDLVLQLNLIADRRNKIVHQADMDPTYQNRRWLIDSRLVDDAVRFIENLSESIFLVVR